MQYENINNFQFSTFKFLINYGSYKTEHFTEEQNEVAKLMKALAHPAKIAIVEYLLSVDTCICNDIVDEIKLAQPTVSQHLKRIKNAGIIQGEIDGKQFATALILKLWKNGAFYLRNFLENS